MAPITVGDVRFTGPALAACLYFPKQLEHLLSPRSKAWITSPLVVRTLAAIIGLDLLRKTSNMLSQRVSNNGKCVKFVPSKELVLITGGCSGIGLLMAKEFAKRGAKVVIVDLNPPQETLPENIHFYQSDVTSVDAVGATASLIRKEHGDPTVLVNNAGVGTLQSILDGDEKSVRNTFDVNTISHFWTTREFVPAMVKKNHGHIVTIASMASYVVHALNVDYCCSKASALSFHEGLSSELRNIYNAPNVRTTVVNPSWIRTPLIERLINSKQWRTPVMEPEYVVNIIVDQVMAGKGGQIVLPPKLNYGTTIRGWPLWMQTGLRNWIGTELKKVRDSLEVISSS
ncbi:short chain dehydrogenase/reductase/methylenetetrahydrofolate reductase/MET12 [Blumeria hordei DH14]|uniref:Short-chain dehydrogenase/reductase 3 n=1 Tax=Blumeria graminis f. sp. hordei (strain DH14) TaxID=546991 RepID=N1JGX9_BLUG1|nr:short chain dehydrogenase/reductase/methylenetetrahydrofolate reductase/MET12 [Blumeria hordei DH14]